MRDPHTIQAILLFFGSLRGRKHDEWDLPFGRRDGRLRWRRRLPARVLAFPVVSPEPEAVPSEESTAA